MPCRCETKFTTELIGLDGPGGQIASSTLPWSPGTVAGPASAATSAAIRTRHVQQHLPGAKRSVTSSGAALIGAAVSARLITATGLSR